jgi:hypothetical protein
MTGDPLEALRGRIDLRQIPFTDRLSRILFFREAQDDALWAGLAVYERPVRECVALRQIRPTLGGPLPATFSARPDRIDIATPAGEFRLAFADSETIVVQALARETGLMFDVPAGHIEESEQGGRAFIGSDANVWVQWHGRGRVTPSPTPGERPSATVHLEPEGGPAAPFALRISRALGSPAAWPRSHDPVAAAEARWRRWFDHAPEVSPPYQTMALYAWWILAANQILPAIDPRRAGVVPSKIGYLGIWNWDACFHALGLRHGDPGAAKDQLRIILAHQLPDGMLPDVIHDTGVLSSTVDVPLSERGYGLPAGWDPDVPIPLTKPPLLAWAARAIWAIDGDDAFLREVYAPIVAAHDWWRRTADPDGNGLYAYDHAYSSGLDDSPLWDEGPPVEAAELNAYLALQSVELAAIAETIGHHVDAARFRDEAAALTDRLVALRWDERAGLFTSTHNGQPIPIATPFGLMPLLTGRLPESISRRLGESLLDTSRFWPRYPVPTVAANELAFDPNRMWRGPVWLNVNRLLVEGLQRSGLPDEAALLRRRTLELAIAHPDFREYYNPLTGEPPPRAAPMFGWAAASFLDLAVAEARDSGR